MYHKIIMAVLSMALSLSCTGKQSRNIQETVVGDAQTPTLLEKGVTGDVFLLIGT